MLHKGIGFVAHGAFGIVYKIKSVVSLCKSGEKVYLARKKHIVEIAETAVYILVIPSGVLRELAVILVGITCLYGTLGSPLLEYFVLVVSDFDCFGVGTLRGYYVRKREKQHKRKYEGHNAFLGDRSA